jgi:tetratricopeptide (TPR) repeat protein
MTSSGRKRAAAHRVRAGAVRGRRVSLPDGRRASIAADRLCARAQSLYAEGRLEDALDCYRQAAELGALKDDDLIFKLRAEYRLDRRDEALGTIKALVARQPQQVEALKFGGRIATAREDWALAQDFWQRLAEADSSDTEAPLQMARIAHRDGVFADASSWALRVVAIEPAHPEGLAIAANAGVRLNQADTGELLARFADVDRDKALALIRQLSRNAQPQTYAEALGAVRKRLSRDREILQLAAEASEFFIVSGLQAEFQSRDLDAAKFYRALRQLDRTSRNAAKGIERLRGYGLVKMREDFRQKEFGRVVEAGRKLVEIDPDCLEAWMTMGRAHLLAEAHEPARVCFARCVELDPDDAWAWLNYARSLDKVDDWQQALAAYRRVVSFGANAGPGYLVESERAITSLYNRAMAAGRDAAARDDIQSGWKHCALALDIEPANDSALTLKKQLLNRTYARISTLWQAGSAEAIEVCNWYLEREPDDIRVLPILGRTLMKEQRFAEARPTWQRLAELQPEEAHPRLQIARCCNWTKQRADGLEAVRETLRLDPDLAEARTIQMQLEALPAP